MAHDITKDVIGTKEFEVQDINKSGEPVNFLGSISLSNHIVNKGYVDAEIVDKSWLKTTAQTGLTGDKTGTFNLTTTGVVATDTLTSASAGGITVSDDLDIGTNNILFFKPFSTNAGIGFGNDFEIRNEGNKISLIINNGEGDNQATLSYNQGILSSNSVTFPAILGLPGLEWDSLFINTIDLGTNTITDELFTGEWVFDNSITINGTFGSDSSTIYKGIDLTNLLLSGDATTEHIGINVNIGDQGTNPKVCGFKFVASGGLGDYTGASISVASGIGNTTALELQGASNSPSADTYLIHMLPTGGSQNLDYALLDESGGMWDFGASDLTTTGTVQAGATTLTASTEPILKLEDTGALNSDREWIQMFNKDSVKMIEIGTISNGNPEIRFGDAESTKVGFPPSDPTYFAFINDSTEMWLGNAADPSLYYNFYNGANVNWGRSVNLQTGNFYGDFKIREGDLTMPKTSGKGIKVDIATPTFGFRDLLGDVISRNTGANKPTLTTYRGTLQDFQFGVNDQEHFKYHIPHDYVKGTDIFIHIHWSHTGAFVTGGTVTFEIEQSYAKGHNQAPFHAPVTATYNGTASTVQYQHILSETQSSASTPTGLQIDTDDLEPDGVIILRMLLNANNITVSEGLVPDPFIHYVDIHYQSTNIATKARAPDFYA